jgi:hypothetical protein
VNRVPRYGQLSSSLALACLAACAFTGCASPPAVPEHPTWADVQPILRADCTSCHGGSAETTGSVNGVAYRLDFFDMTPESCGAAAAAVASSRFAAEAASQIRFDLTSDNPAIRPRMPPEPAPWLEDWKWQTVLRWSRNPIKGTAPPGNRPPVLRVTAAGLSQRNRYGMSMVLDDPDGDAAVGLLTIGDDNAGKVTFSMNRPGAFSVDFDISQWPLGLPPIQATVCDGWNWATLPIALP